MTANVARNPACRQCRQQPDELLQRVRTGIEPAVTGEYECLRFEHWHVEIFRAVPHVGGQAGSHLETADLATGLFGAGKECGFCELKIPKRLSRDVRCRRRPAEG